MRKILSAALSLFVLLLVAACADNSADIRLRMILGVPANQPLTEVVVAENIEKSAPIGTPEQLLAEKAKAMGVGKDTLSSYSIVKERNLAIVRIEFDPTTFGVTKESWIISLQLDANQRLQSIVAKRYVTGL